MTQDKSVSLADDLRRGACGQECLCDEAAAQLDAMQECVEALRKARAYLDDMSDHPEPGDTIQMIDAALAKLEKANG